MPKGVGYTGGKPHNSPKTKPMTTGSKSPASGSATRKGRAARKAEVKGTFPVSSADGK